MTEMTCPEDGCTINTTGICGRTGDSTPCDHATATATVEEEIAQQIAAAESAVVESPSPETAAIRADGISLHPGVELGLDDIVELMAEEHACLIGILGAYNAGKTFFLIALYLMCTCGETEDHGFAFAGSLTLPGFEDRARATRQWADGVMPDKMSIHTQVADDRSPGFMHLDLLHRASGRRNRLLLSDLPGEWSTDLIKSIRYVPRLGFLARADAILIMIEGPNLADLMTRHQEVERHKMLIDRVAAIATPVGRRLAIVVTKADAIGMVAPDGLAELVEYAIAAGFKAKGMLVVSLSGDPEIRSGTGVFDVIKWMTAPRNRARINVRTLNKPPTRLFGWPPVTGGEVLA